MPSLLLIEDSAEIHLLLSSMVAAHGTLHSAYSAAEGIELFRKTTPDVVLLDVGLPDDSGLNVFRKIHEIDAHIPVIFLTGGSTTETAIEAMSMGAFEYQLKPFEPAALARCLASAFEASRLARTVPQAIEEYRSRRRWGFAAWPMRGHARGLQAHRPRVEAGCHRSDYRRKRNG